MRSAGNLTEVEGHPGADQGGLACDLEPGRFCSKKYAVGLEMRCPGGAFRLGLFRLSDGFEGHEVSRSGDHQKTHGERNSFHQQHDDVSFDSMGF
jgi:hypothetical protein